MCFATDVSQALHRSGALEEHVILKGVMMSKAQLDELCERDDFCDEVIEVVPGRLYRLGTLDVWVSPHTCSPNCVSLLQRESV